MQSLFRLPEVMARTGLSRSEIYRREALGQFPRRVSLGARSVGWLSTEIKCGSKRGYVRAANGVLHENAGLPQVPPLQRQSVRAGPRATQAHLSVRRAGLLLHAGSRQEWCRNPFQTGAPRDYLLGMIRDTLPALLFRNVPLRKAVNRAKRRAHVWAERSARGCVMQPEKKSPATARTDTTTRRPQQTDKQKACKCPRCNYEAPASLFVPGWLDDLKERAVRFWHFGFGPDLAAMSLVELHALWRWLLRQGG